MRFAVVVCWCWEGVALWEHLPLPGDTELSLFRVMVCATAFRWANDADASATDYADELSTTSKR